MKIMYGYQENQSKSSVKTKKAANNENTFFNNQIQNHPIQMMRRAGPKLGYGPDPLLRRPPGDAYQPDPTPQITLNQQQGYIFEQRVRRYLEGLGRTVVSQLHLRLAPRQQDLYTISEMERVNLLSSGRMMNYTRIIDFYDGEKGYECKSGSAGYALEQVCFDGLVNIGVPCCDIHNNPIQIKEIIPVFERNFPVDP